MSGIIRGQKYLRILLSVWHYHGVKIPISILLSVWHYHGGKHTNPPFTLCRALSNVLVKILTRLPRCAGDTTHQDLALRREAEQWTLVPRLYLFIHMQLCGSTLTQWLSARNAKIAAGKEMVWARGEHLLLGSHVC